MRESSRYWIAAVSVNVAGAAFVYVGADIDMLVQLLGYLLLPPGSLAASLLPLHRLWFRALWACCQTDATGLSHLLYLPAAISINLTVLGLLRRLKRR